MIAMRDAMRAVQQHDRGDVTLTTETSIWAGDDVLKDVDRHLPIPAMSKGSAVALGVSGGSAWLLWTGRARSGQG